MCKDTVTTNSSPRWAKFPCWRYVKKKTKEKKKKRRREFAQREAQAYEVTFTWIISGKRISFDVAYSCHALKETRQIFVVNCTLYNAAIPGSLFCGLGSFGYITACDSVQGSRYHILAIYCIGQVACCNILYLHTVVIAIYCIWRQMN